MKSQASPSQAQSGFFFSICSSETDVWPPHGNKTASANGDPLLGRGSRESTLCLVLGLRRFGVNDLCELGSCTR